MYIYKETKSSQLEDKHPKFHRSVNFIKEDSADVLVSWKLDKISSSNFEFQKLVREVGYRFVAVEDGQKTKVQGKRTRRTPK